MSETPPPHTSTTPNDPAPTPFKSAPLVDERKRKGDSDPPYPKSIRPAPAFNFAPLSGKSGPPAPFNFRLLPGHARKKAPPAASTPKPAPRPVDDCADDEWLNFKPAASTRKDDLPTYAEWGNTKPAAKNEAPPAASTGNVAAPPPTPGMASDSGTGESKQGDDSPPHRRKVVPPPTAPAPPVMPIPPISAPVAPPAHGVVSPLSWLMDVAFGRTARRLHKNATLLSLRKRHIPCH